MGVRRLVGMALVSVLSVGVVAGVSAAADADDPVTPAVVELALTPGQSESRVVEVFVPPPERRFDVVFVADTTGSMTDVIEAVQTNATQVLTELRALGDVGIGVAAYRDFPTAFQRPLPGNDFAFAYLTGPSGGIISEDVAGGEALIQDALAAWRANQGGDTPEAQFFALDQLSDRTIAGWRDDAQRIIVWFGDAPGHDPICSEISGEPADITEASVTSKLVSQEITVVAISTVGDGGLSTGPGLEADPVVSPSDYEGFCAETAGSAGQAVRIAEATQGAFLDGVGPGELLTAITSAVETVLFDVTVDSTDCAARGLQVAFDPPSFERVVGPRVVAFGATFSLPPDSSNAALSCTLEYLLDGELIGTQIVSNDPVVDSDGDGVPDPDDVCPGLDDTIDVDADGIADCNDPLVDSDGDGIADSADVCSDTVLPDQPKRRLGFFRFAAQEDGTFDAGWRRLDGRYTRRHRRVLGRPDHRGAAPRAPAHQIRHRLGGAEVLDPPPALTIDRCPLTHPSGPGSRGRCRRRR